MQNPAKPNHLIQLIEQAKTYPPITVAVVDAAEEHVLESAHDAFKAGLITPVLIGEQSRIEEICSALGFSSDHAVIVPAGSELEAAQKGVDLVLKGQAHALMKGWIHTDVLMHPVLAHLRTARRVSHVFVADLATYHKLLFITDAAINIEPDLITKAVIIQNAVDLARVLGVETPKVEALSTIELVKPAISSTSDAACLSKMAQRRQITGAIVDGPLAFDNAISRDAAQTKLIDSEVAGDVDILLAPDLTAGNILAKDLEYLAHATLAGIVIGAKVPMMLTSRSDPSTARIASAAICSIMHQHWHEFA